MTSLRDLKEDLCEIKQDVKEIRAAIFDFGSRTSKLESGQSAIWWVLAISLAATGGIAAWLFQLAQQM